MGAWGYKPLQNDDALNYYGGFHKINDMKQLIKEGLDGKHEYCCAPYELAGVILASLGVYELGCTEHIDIVLNAIKSRQFNIEELRNNLTESGQLLLSISVIDIETRKKILIACNKKLQHYHLNPIEYDNEVRKVCEIINEYLVKNTKNFNKNDIISISEQDLNWLISVFEDSERQDALDFIHMLYPNGLLIFNVNNTLIGIYPNEPKIDKRVKDSIDYCKSLGITMEEVNLKACNNINEYIKKQFSKGFKMKNDLDEDGYSITSFYSNDYNTIVTYRAISDTFCDKLYSWNDEDNIIVKLLKNFVSKSANTSNKTLTGNKAIDKFYDKHGKIIGYRITDGKKVMDVYSEQIKQAIASGAIKFDNLTLTKDGRLYMTEPR